MQIIPLKQWVPDFRPPLIVAGPCAAETEEQVLATARPLSAIEGVHIFRAGLWKPRRRPESFQGVGEKGLAWLRRVRSTTRLKVATEVANTQHVERALESGIDILWIGARTTGNPFSVQEIAEALRGHDIPVMVKNPPHADLSLWMGAFERLAKSGLKRLVAIHRGFTPYFCIPGHYRNSPLWSIPSELKRLWPQLPLLCDPSHISGRRESVGPLCRQAMGAGFEGLMIEAHANPSRALSDAGQQVTCSQLEHILRELRPGQTDDLDSLRHQIDSLDRELMEALGKRFQVAKQIGAVKRDREMSPLQKERLHQHLGDLMAAGPKLGLRPQFVEKLYHLIHREALHCQSDNPPPTKTS